MRAETVVVSALAIAHASPAAADPAELMWGEEIAEVRVSGIRRAESAAIADSLECRRGRPLSAAAVAADVRALWRRGRFADVGAEVAADRSGRPVVRFAVDPLPAIAAVEVAGNRAIRSAAALEAIGLAPGAPASPSAIARGVRSLRTAYAGRGHALTEIDVVSRSAPGGVELAFAVTEGEAIAVRRVGFAGNRRIGARELRAAVATRVGAALDRGELERDRARVLGRYHDRGYIEARVTGPRLQLSRDRRFAYLRFSISEGPRYRFGAFASDGSAIKSGSPFSGAAVAAVVQAIAARLRDRGHAFARVEPRLHPDPGRRVVDVDFAVEPGPLPTIEAIEIRGNRRTRDRVIRRELAVEVGDRFTQGALELSRRRLLALGFFESVEVTAAPATSPDRAVITVKVEERMTGTFTVGAGFASSDGFIATAGVGQANLFGTGHSLSLSAQLSARQQNFALRYLDPRVLDTDFSAGIEIYNRREQWHGFERRATGGALTVGRPLGDHLRGSLTYRLEDVGAEAGGEIWNLYRLGAPASVADGLFRGGLVSSLRATLAYDSRDDRLLPSRGTEVGGYFEVASPRLGSELEHTQIGGWLRHHRPLIGPIGLHLGAEAGLITTADPLGVPIGQRFQLGGLGGVRGYQLGGLGPRLELATDPSGAMTELALGGNLMAKTSAELTVPIVPSIGMTGVVFFDVGNVYNLDRRFCDGSASLCPETPSTFLGDLRASVGFGLRWQSPIGPLRFEWGIPLHREPGDPPVRFHFGLGLGF
jgi:outer membrane protein insertion porin family